MKSIDNPQDKDAITARFNRLTAETRGLWGRMNVNQMVCHCADQMKICVGAKPARKKGNLLTQTLVKFVALNLPLTMPKNMRTIYELDPEKGAMTQPVDFAKDRSELTGLVTDFYAMPGSRVFSHPVFGKLSKRELGKLTYMHLNHHLQQFGV